VTALWSNDVEAGHPDTVFTPYAEARETHSAVVFLVGDRAYKLKKPVDLGFLDFSSRDKRLAVLRRELELNRRLAPDVYLGVSDVADVDGSVLDHLLVMRRMPDQRRLAHLVRSGSEVTDELREIAHFVAAFHSRCARSAAIAVSGGRDALLSRWQSNFEEAGPFVGTRLDKAKYDEVRTLATRYLRGRGDLFADRVGRSAVVDGHGDLLAEDIFCLPDGPRILDCIEFDDSLRHLDRLDDVACLAMDLERLGSSEAAQTLMGVYLELSGDNAPTSLVHHYIAYRAFMRAKVACLPRGRDAVSAGDPARLLDLAHGHLNEGRVRLVLVGGPPGTGKSTVASALADALGCAVLSSDRIRKELAGVPAETDLRAGYGEGIYTQEWSERTYGELRRRAEKLLSMGESVVMDATWANERQRAQATALADGTASDLTQFRCQLPPELAEARIAERRSVSDADPAIAAAVRSRFDDWPDALDVDTRQPVDAVVARVQHRLQPWRTTSVVARPRMPAD